MKFINSIQQIGAAVLLAVAGLAVAPEALAEAPGQCSSDTGPQDYPFNFSSIMTDPSQNIAGKIIPNAAGNAWNSSSTFHATCGCTNMTAAYATAVSELPVMDHSDGTDTYFVLNDYLAVGSQVWVAGSRKAYVPAPFDNVSNLATTSGSCTSQPYSSGAKGQVNLYFRRPFVGQSVIPPTKILSVYLASTSGVKSASPVSTVTMSGTVIVPQNCDINPQPVTVDFGDILSGSFKTKGAKPDNFTPVNKQLTLACRNISEGVKISLSFQGTPDVNEPTALKTNNSDIAVKIEDRNGNAITPQSGRLPVAMDYAAQTGSTEINLYPVNTTGNNPAVGTFNATATIKAEIE
jgi:type 1 fimbria pilin